MKYINLYTQTEYSLLNSTIKIDSLIKYAKDNNLNSLAICDTNNMYGVVKFYQKCIDNNIKPVIGLCLTLESRYNFYNSILLFSKNNNGYKNLMKITTLRKLKKEVFIDNLKEYLDDIIVVLPNEENELIKMYNEKNVKFKELFSSYSDINDLYIGLDLQTMKMRDNIDEVVRSFKNLNLKMVALQKVTYLNKEDFDAYKILKCVDKNIKNYKYSEKEVNQYMLNDESAFDLFRKYPMLLNETINIANKCSVSIDFNGYKMPKYEIKGNNTDDYLYDLAMLGLKIRLTNNKISVENYHIYIDRLKYELKIISQMGFSDYFLIVYDFIKYAKREGILVGPGRGSAPSSLVAYSIGITELDPLKYDLLFERFLNPERISMPDIDTDFPDVDRSRIIKYTANKYGKNKVAHICTFGTYGPRPAIRDIVKVLGVNNTYLEEILRHVNDVKSIRQVLDSDAIYKQMYDEDETINLVTNLCLKIEDLPRNLSVHAAGIIMADKDLINYTPLENGINDIYQTQYEASDLEKLGLVKIDFLGIKNLTIIDKVLKLINDKINIYNLPLEDKKTYDLISKGNTNGIFQLESSGMKNTLINLKAINFIDIVNALALYRPGPMDMIPSFINRKEGKEKIIYLHNDLEEILKPTYGIIVYQEQILLIANKFAGYTLGEADVLRRAVSKKNVAMLQNEQKKFVTNALQKGHSLETANQIFDYILKFANYGFNKSHSVAYSYVSYQMAFLKAHYFKEFMAVMMSDKVGSVSSIKTYIFECQKEGYEVLIPSINISNKDFVVYQNKIYYSLLGINGLGEVIVNQLLEERNKGLFKDYDEFILRTKNILNKKHVENLINSGALDDFKISRKSMYLEYEQSLQLANYGETFKNQLSEHIFSSDEYQYDEISAKERVALGFNLKFDIFRKYQSVIRKFLAITIDKMNFNKIYRCVFCFKNIKEIITKKNEKMAFCTIYDNTSEMDAVMFPKLYNQIISEDFSKVFLGELKIEERKNTKQAVINKIVALINVI